MLSRELILALTLASSLNVNATSVANSRLEIIPQKTEKVTGDFLKRINLKDIKSLLPEPVIEVKEVEEVEPEVVEEYTEENISEEVVEYIEEPQVEEVVEAPSNRIYCKFEVSFYCGCYSCTQNGNLQTASGAYAVEGVTVATPSDIPFGSSVYIEALGNTYVAQDRGGYIQYTYDEYGNLVMRLDVFCNDHNRALEYGRFYSDGYVDLAE